MTLIKISRIFSQICWHHNHIASRSFFVNSQCYSIRLNLQSSKLLPSKFFYYPSTSTYSSSSSSFDDNDSDSESQNEDRYFRQWLASKTFLNQTIDDFMPSLKDGDEIAKMEWILQEYEIVKYDNSICPSYLPTDRVREMMEIDNLQKLHSYFIFLYKRENQKNAEKLRRADNRPKAAIELRKAHDSEMPLEMGIMFDSETGKPLYGKWRNSCFIDLSRKHEYTAFLPQNIASAQFGQKLIVDFSYENCMYIQEKKSLTKQLCFGYKFIRESADPFDLWYCNLDDKHKTYQLLDHSFGWNRGAFFTSHFIHRSPRSYLDLFPRDKMVYLCPDSNYDLTHFDDEATYIIGGLVDRSVVKPVSLAKCKKEGIKHARLPLDQHLSMIGSKVLTIDQVVCILVRLKEGLSMEKALKEAVPERKLKKPEQIELERNRRLLRLKYQRKDKHLFV